MDYVSAVLSNRLSSCISICGKTSNFINLTNILNNVWRYYIHASGVLYELVVNVPTGNLSSSFYLLYFTFVQSTTLISVCNHN